MYVFLSMSVDTSNVRNIKFFPIVVRYFNKNGINNKLVDFHNIFGETSDILVECVLKTIEKFKLYFRFIDFCLADKFLPEKCRFLFNFLKIISKNFTPLFMNI